MRRPPLSWRLASVLLCGIAVWSVVGSVIAESPPTYRGRPLVEVLGEFRALGLDLIFSSAVVGRDLRVTVEPSASEPRLVLDEILAPLGLRAEEGPGGSILILPSARETGSLRGRVLSAGDRIPIAGATVRVAQTDNSTTSDAAGAFVMREIPVGTYDVTVEALGFSAATIYRTPVASKDGRPLTVELNALPEFVTRVVVTPSRYSLVRQEQSSNHALTSEDVVLVPTIGGDISRVVERLPGVTAPDNSAAFSVRGSVAADVALVLDGLELYDPFHLQSFQSPFSLIDSNVVDRVDFFGGGFTADLGDRHGGFVEISTVVPGETVGGEIEVGTLNSRVSYRSAPASPFGSWLLSVRGWYPEQLWNTIELPGGDPLDPRFGDVYAKAFFTLSPRTLLSAHGLLAYDRLTFKERGEQVNETFDVLTRNGYAWLRLLNSWSSSLSSETVISGGRIERQRDGLSDTDAGPLIVGDKRTINFLGLKHDSMWEISKAHALKGGLEVRGLDAAYRYSNDLPDDPLSSTSIALDPDGLSLGAYAAHRALLSPDLATELGLRWDRQTYTNDNQLSPRFNAVWRASERSELRLALGRFSQSQRIHELHVEDDEQRFGPAEVADQAELSFQHGFRGGLRLRLDAYYRRLSKLRPRYENLFEPVELFPETIEDRRAISPSAARLRGVEAFLRGDAQQRLFWWVSYTLASAEDVIDGTGVPRSWDQPHTGKFLVGYRRDDRWSVSLSGTVRTGWPTTPVSAQKQPDGSMVAVPIEDQRNSDRLPGYARLDGKLRRSFALPQGRLWLTLDVVNLTDRDNACCIDDFLFEPQEDGTVDVQRQFDHWLGLTPLFNVLWEF